jgi:hypothetical protein
MRLTIREEAADDFEGIVAWVAKEDRAAAIELGDVSGNALDAWKRPVSPIWAGLRQSRAPANWLRHLISSYIKLMSNAEKSMS